jgi:DNA polymerase-3 subunit alpha
MMCFLTLEDFSGQIEVVIFPRVFEKVSGLLLPDMPVAVAGRLNLHEEESKILADSIIPLAQVGTEVRIKIRKSQEIKETLDKLKNALCKHKGATVVYLHLTDSSRLIKTEPEYWIDLSETAKTEIEAVLGPGAVISY